MSIRRFYFPSIVALVFTTGIAFAAEPVGDALLSDPVEILKRSEAALKQLKSVEYSFVREPILADVGKSARIEGSVKMSGWAYGTVKKFRADLMVKRAEETEATAVRAGCDGDVTFLFDEVNKKVFADMDPNVLGKRRGEVRAALSTLEFMNPEPFESEKKSEKTALKGVVPVEGVACYELAFPREEDSGSTLFIGTGDFLPRRIELTFKNRAGAVGGRRMTLTALATNPVWKQDPFVLAVPEGFTKTDDFAP